MMFDSPVKKEYTLCPPPKSLEELLLVNTQEEQPRKFSLYDDDGGRSVVSALWS
jgi:hypothetical protein